MKKTDRTNANRSKTGHLMALLTSLKPGEFFYCDLLPKTITSYAVNFNVKIKMETVISTNPKTLHSEKIQKITIL